MIVQMLVMYFKELFVLEYSHVLFALPILLFTISYILFCVYFLALVFVELCKHSGDEEYYERNNVQSILVSLTDSPRISYDLDDNFAK